MVPTEKELLEFIKNRGFVNYSIIAKNFEIKNSTVSDLINDLEKKKLVKVQKLGGNKLILLVKKGEKLG